MSAKNSEIRHTTYAEDILFVERLQKTGMHQRLMVKNFLR